MKRYKWLAIYRWRDAVTHRKKIREIYVDASDWHQVFDFMCARAKLSGCPEIESYDIYRLEEV